MSKLLGASAICASLLAGCAEMPPVKARYYFPQGETKLVVTQTLGCKADANGNAATMVVATDAIASTSYSANYSRWGTVNFGSHGGQLKDSDLALTFTQDGRLSGINSSETGEGVTLVKDAATLAAAIVGVAFKVDLATGGNKSSPHHEQSIFDSDCKAITEFAKTKSGDDSKTASTVTLTYTLNFFYADGASKIVADAANNAVAYPADASACLDLIADPDSDGIYRRLRTIYQKQRVCIESPSKITVPGIDSPTPWVDGATAPGGYTYLQLNEISLARLAVYGPSSDLSGTERIWRGTTPIPLETYYALPIPKGVVFGKQQFTLALSDPGTITKLEYATNTGATAVLEAGGAVASALPTTAKLASEKQAQADLIYEQRRLVACKADPTNCSK